MFNYFNNSLFRKNVSLNEQMDCIKSDMLDENCTNYLHFKLLVDHLEENKEKNKSLISYLYSLPIGEQVLTDAYLLSNLEILCVSCQGCSCYLIGATCTLGGCTGAALAMSKFSLYLPFFLTLTASSVGAFFGVIVCAATTIQTCEILDDEPKFRKIDRHMSYIPNRLQAKETSEFHNIKLEAIVTYLKELSQVKMNDESTPLLIKSASNT